MGARPAGGCDPASGAHAAHEMSGALSNMPHSAMECTLVSSFNVLQQAGSGCTCGGASHSTCSRA